MRGLIGFYHFHYGQLWLRTRWIAVKVQGVSVLGLRLGGREVICLTIWFSCFCGGNGGLRCVQIVVFEFRGLLSRAVIVG
jgi:hypothetical protein